MWKVPPIQGAHNETSQVHNQHAEWDHLLNGIEMTAAGSVGLIKD